MKYFVYCRKSSEEKERQILSIPSQLGELTPFAGKFPDVTIVEVLSESHSAKAPGRPVFDDMIRRIQAGEAEGIIAWLPDRLARNSIDGGTIVYLLDTGKLKDLKFPSFLFQNTALGKFMLQMAFVQSKYYVDDLSQNVKRGARTKAELGWLPSWAPIGYLNHTLETSEKIIIPDPERFGLVKRLLELMLTGAYSPRMLWKIATREWGLRTKPRKKIGGGLITLSGVYRILSNPFYAGIVPWAGKLTPGRHQAMITLDDLNRIQALLGRPDRPRPKRHEFAFTGQITCGECGCAVTAEHKVNRYGSSYTYYHCTWRKTNYECRQKVISAQELGGQLLDFLHRVTLSEKVYARFLKLIEGQRTSRGETELLQRRSLKDAKGAMDKQLDTLLDLRLRDLLSDDAFHAKQRALEEQRLALAQRIDAAGQPTTFEPDRTVLFFMKQAASWFRRDDIEIQRLILRAAGSNPTLRDKKITVSAAIPFREWTHMPSHPTWLSIIKDVRTFVTSQEPEALSKMAAIRKVTELVQEREQKEAA